MSSVLTTLVGSDSLSPIAALSDLWSNRLAPFHPDLQWWVEPGTVAELADVITAAHRDRISVAVCGRGSKLDWGSPLDPVQWIVSTRRLTQVIDHAASDLTATVEAGLTLKELQQTLARQGQFWPVDPLYSQEASIGGILATATTGSWRHRYGSVRDLLLGIALVRSDGQRVKAGGRVVKNVAGYDLMKLFTGSYGTLGILTQVTLRLFPLPSAQRELLLTGSAARIGQVSQQLINSTLTPVGVDILSPALMQGLGYSSEWGLWLEWHGWEESIAAQQERFLQIGGDLTPLTLTGSLRPMLEAALTQPGSVLAKLGLLGNESTQVLDAWVRRYPDSRIQLHRGSGLGYWSLPSDQVTAEGISQLRQQVGEGFVSLLRAPSPLKQASPIWGYSGNAGNLSSTLRQQFDPQRILNPGQLEG